jgi:hypothetical protein
MTSSKRPPITRDRLLCAALAAVSLLAPATSFAMASHEVRTEHHSAYSPVAPRALRAEPPVRLTILPASPVRLATRDPLHPTLHPLRRSAHVRPAAKLKR